MVNRQRSRGDGEGRVADLCSSSRSFCSSRPSCSRPLPCPARAAYHRAPGVDPLRGVQEGQGSAPEHRRPVKGGERCGAAQGDSGERCGNNALIRWLLMSGKHTTVWPSPPIAAVKKTRRGPWSVSSYYPPLPQISPVAYPPLSHFLRCHPAVALPPRRLAQPHRPAPTHAFSQRRR